MSTTEKKFYVPPKTNKKYNKAYIFIESKTIQNCTIKWQNNQSIMWIVVIEMEWQMSGMTNRKRLLTLLKKKKTS